VQGLRKKKKGGVKGQEERKVGKSNVIGHLSFGVYDVCLEWGEEAERNGNPTA
jgi:hypothetical protein